MQKCINKTVVLRYHVEENLHPNPKWKKPGHIKTLLRIHQFFRLSIPASILIKKQKSIIEVMARGQEDYLEIELEI